MSTLVQLRPNDLIVGQLYVFKKRTTLATITARPTEDRVTVQHDDGTVTNYDPGSFTVLFRLATLTEWRAYESRRQQVISANRSNRLSSNPQRRAAVTANPIKMPRPQVPQLYDADGNFIGTGQLGQDFDELVERANANPWGGGGPVDVSKTKWVDAH